MRLWNRCLLRSLFPTVKKLATKLKRSKDSTEDDPWSGRSKTLTTDEQFYTIHRIVSNDRHLIAMKSIGISTDLVHTILTDFENKQSARLFPRMLMPEQKLKRVEISTIQDSFF